MPSLQVNSHVPMEGGPVAALCHALGELGLAGRITLEPVGVGSAMDSLVIVPNLENPRILVPAGQRKAASASLQRYSADLGISTRLQRLFAAQAMRLWGPRTPIARHQLRLARGINQGLVAYLSESLGQPVTFSMSIGKVRANRKPILQLFSTSGESLGFAKVGSNEFTARLVRQEAQTLRELGEQRLDHLELPSVLHSGSWEGLELLVMATMPTTALAPPRRLARLRARAEGELHRVFFAGRKPLGSSLWLASWLSAARQHESPWPLWQRWSIALEQLAGRYGSEQLEFSATHGDWTAWNMADYRGRLQVWDWERFAANVPAGLDRLHFAVHEAFGRSGVSEQTLRAVLGEAKRGEQLLAACYLADLAGRYLLGEREQQVQAVQQKTAVLVAVLETTLGD
ncbi:hypothetical protein [Arthrobacter sp. MYb224]|uniref:hypothetical protein n=1 Tax=Arthrobacter sp. MYb224 TaxID=1848600 RepID=UPI0011B067F0|nr:hypothetical protein [Arthrobacter sp. MYb224]